MRDGKFDIDSEIEKLLNEDSKKIEIDMKFKAELKNRIMTEDAKNNIVYMKNKRTSNFKRYLKIASSFMICLFLGGSLYHFPSKFVKGDNNTTKEVEFNKPKVAEVYKLGEMKETAFKTESNKKEETVKEDTSRSEDTTKNNEADNSSEKLTSPEKKNQSDDNNNENNNNENKNIEKIEEVDVAKGNDTKVDNTKKETSETSTVPNNEEKKDDSVKEESKPLNKVDSGIEVAREPEEETQNNNEIALEESILDDENKMNELLEISKNNKAAVPVEEEDGPELVVPKIDEKIDEEIHEDVNKKLDVYDSRASKDGTAIVKVIEDSLYKIKGDEKELILENQGNEVKLNKPNLLENGDVIYCQTSIVDESTVHHIYKYDVEKNEQIKIVEGKNPMVSSDGKLLAFESKNKIWIIYLESNVTKMVDDGNFPSWSYDGRYLSYAKEEIEKETLESGEEKENLYSNMWIYNLDNDDKYELINKECITDNEKIDKWAHEVRKGGIYNVISKYTYYESLWSTDNKNIYVIRRDNESEVYEFIQFKLD